MEDQKPTITNININNINNTSSSSGIASNSSTTSPKEKNNNSPSEPVRSRWTPKPEQILILESIFNSGMVNPPKEETVRIRKLLEKFGAVGDANVFYWFQNRRSRSRRRQRQLQASLAASVATPTPPTGLLGGGGGGLEFYDYGNQLLLSNNNNNNNNNNINSENNACTTSPLGYCSGVNDVFTSFSSEINGISPHHQLDSTSQTSVTCTSNSSNHEFQSGTVTVFINGVATQVAEGTVDMKTMFGEDLMLLHSSGLPVPFNHFGISLQHGESYFLVPRLT